MNDDELDAVLEERGLTETWSKLAREDQNAWLNYLSRAEPLWRTGRMYEIANRLAEGRGVPWDWRYWLRPLME